MSDNRSMRFLFGDRELLLVNQDPLSAQVEVVVNPTDTGLSHASELGRRIVDLGGETVQQESAQLLREYSLIDTGMAVFTSAGALPFKAIIHAVMPPVVQEDVQQHLEQAISRSLQLCDMNEWVSVAVPLASSHAAEIELAAQAYFRVITRFWDARHDCHLAKVVICLSADQFPRFFAAFREQGFQETQPQALTHEAHAAGEIELDEAEITAQDNSDIESWFK